MQETIQTEHLAYTYPGVEDTPGVAVFKDLNLTIENGSFVAILGSNGCGKSTLAKHFNAILLPTGGKVWVYGMDTADEEKLIQIRRSVGMVFQNPDNQIVANVVEEDVAFGPENLGVASPEIRRRVELALKQVGMYEYREHAPHTALRRAEAAHCHCGRHCHGAQVHRPGRTHRHAGPQGPTGGHGDRPAAESGKGHYRDFNYPPHG